MSTTPLPNSVIPNQTENPSVTDIKVSWRSLKQNIKAFLGIASFSLGATFLCMIFVTVIVLIVLLNMYDSSIVYDELYTTLITYFMLPIELIILWGFFGSGYGLAYDIMSSGDGFAEAKSGFLYFQKFWWQYIVLALISNISVFLTIFPAIPISNMSLLQQFLYFFSVHLLTFATNTIFFLTFPSLTAQGSFIKCFKENFAILRNHFKRVVSSMGLIYLIFNLPIGILSSVYFSNLNYFDGSPTIITTVFMILATLFGYSIVNPMWNLVATRVYNSFTEMDDGITIKTLF
ncbi:hypothetical protein [Candidatus Lokiarchaeum ossiferum]|uniref:hypothetical protein n=1 Tax=Candidatus Lokiarchaeum ossiferum TaxID=2951803 RepID=UPI00352F583E